ncbi:MAG: hypothetical protein HS113_13230 [Verrucomicrobiales bacterium]|nr:hypothetical protein [Verrucomicrobiales bacterium]
MKIELNVTRGSLSEARRQSYQPWDLFRITNLVSPRDWLISLTFDAENRNHLAITPSPKLTDRELMRLLDGRFAGVYAADEIRLELSTGHWKVDALSQTTADSRATYFEAAELQTTAHGQLLLCGYRPPHDLQAPQRCSAWFAGNTWLGSRKYESRTYIVAVDVFGTPVRVSPSSLAPGRLEEPCLVTSTTLLCSGRPVGEARLEFSPQTVSPHTVLRHALFGQFDPQVFLPGFWREINPHHHGLRIELDSGHIEWMTSTGPHDHHRLAKLLKTLVKQVHNCVLPSDKYCAFLNQAIRLERIAAARRLTQRQARAQRAPKVYVGNTVLCNIPTCENELVALYMKLEASGRLPAPLECHVLEYTAKQGIDALADFRLSPTAALSRWAPVEFEHHLENYFTHQHPPEQTALIICWDRGSDELGQEVCCPTEFPWLWTLLAEDRNIPVVMLREVNTLAVKGETS